MQFIIFKFKIFCMRSKTSSQQLKKYFDNNACFVVLVALFDVH